MFNNPGVVAARSTRYLRANNLTLGIVADSVDLEGELFASDVRVATTASSVELALGQSALQVNNISVSVGAGIADLSLTAGPLFTNDVLLDIAVSPVDVSLTGGQLFANDVAVGVAASSVGVSFTGGLLTTSDVEVPLAVTSADISLSAGSLVANDVAVATAVTSADIAFAGDVLTANDVTVATAVTSVGISGVLTANDVVVATAVASVDITLSAGQLTANDVVINTTITSADIALAAGDLTVSDVAVDTTVTPADLALTADDLTVNDVDISVAVTPADIAFQDFTVNDVAVATTVSSATIFGPVDVQDVLVGVTVPSRNLKPASMLDYFPFDIDYASTISDRVWPDEGTSSLVTGDTGFGNAFVSEDFTKELDYVYPIHTGPLTIEMRSKIGLEANNNRIYFQMRTVGGTIAGFLGASVQEEMDVTWIPTSIGGTGDSLVIDSGPNLLDEWRHCAFVIDTDETRVYFDGVLSGSVAQGSNDYTEGVKLRFGRGFGDTEPVMDELVITSGAKYSSNFNPLNKPALPITYVETRSVTVGVAASSVGITLAEGDLTANDVAVATAVTEASISLPQGGDLVVNNVTLDTSVTSATIAEVVDSTISLWHLNDSYADAKGVNDFVVGAAGSPEFVTGVFGNAKNLNLGSMDVSLASPLGPSSDWTIEGWMRFSAYATNANVCMRATSLDSLGDRVVWMRYDASGGFNRFYIQTWDSAGTFITFGSSLYETSFPWDNHWAVCYDASENRLDIFIDGERKASATPAAALDPINYILFEGQAINLSVDEVRISNEVRYTGTTYTVPTAPFT